MNLMRTSRYTAEYFALRLLMGLFGILPPALASNLGGAILGFLGPRMGVHRLAQRNIASVFPDMPAPARDAILHDMWNHLGRIIAEYPHLETLARKYTTFENPEKFAALRDDDKPALLISGHIGNWEVMPPALLFQLGLTMHSVYRAPNNPRVDKLLSRMRSFNGQLKSFGKNRRGMMEILRALQGGAHIGMLIDQKMNTGIEAMFFGMPAMTSTAFVDLAHKLDCPLVMGRIVRTHGCNFKMHMAEPLNLYDNTGAKKQTAALVAEAHAQLEAWIKEYPAQWLWTHKRWRQV